MSDENNNQPKIDDTNNSNGADSGASLPANEQGTELEEKEDIGALRKELAETQQQRDEYLDGWQRGAAEFVNYKRRIEREREQFYLVAVGNVARRYLDIVDDLNRALKNCPKEGDGALWANGIELIYRKLLSFLDNEGVKVMETKGQLFDPTFHEAISQEESPEHQSGEIIETVQNGYLIGDRVLRPARVRVAK
jgi:molecular chaperone GrpE